MMITLGNERLSVVVRPEIGRIMGLIPNWDPASCVVMGDGVEFSPGLAVARMGMYGRWVSAAVGGVLENVVVWRVGRGDLREVVRGIGDRRDI